MAANPNGLFQPDELMPWKRLDPPFFWPELGAYVIGDRCLPDGTRQHIVEGYVPIALVVANAQVFWLEDLLPDTLPDPDGIE